jgi:hypothetical protein
MGLAPPHRSISRYRSSPDPGASPRLVDSVATRRERASRAGEARPAHRRRGDRPRDLRLSVRSGEWRTENLHARVARERLEGICHPRVLGELRGPLEEALHAGRPRRENEQNPGLTISGVLPCVGDTLGMNTNEPAGAVWSVSSSLKRSRPSSTYMNSSSSTCR